jgi:hypothetical protein
MRSSESTRRQRTSGSPRITVRHHQQRDRVEIMEPRGDASHGQCSWFSVVTPVRTYYI